MLPSSAPNQIQSGRVVEHSKGIEEKEPNENTDFGNTYERSKQDLLLDEFILVMGQV